MGKIKSNKTFKEITIKKIIANKNLTLEEKRYKINLLLNYEFREINEGDKVKFNIKMIEADIGFEKRKNSKEPHIAERNKFIYENLDKEMTVVVDPNYKKLPLTIVSLKEDTHDPKFLFQVADLIKI